MSEVKLVDQISKKENVPINLGTVATKKMTKTNKITRTNPIKPKNLPPDLRLLRDRFLQTKLTVRSYQPD